MDSIEPEQLYDEQGDISPARPLFQGDVFAGVRLPGFDEGPMTVQIVAHPCAMRKGPNLTPRVTVAPVRPHAVVRGEKGWNGNLRVMPLAALDGGRHHTTAFVDVTAGPAELLTRGRRIATLSHHGIYVLQQRLIKHYTRVDMPLETLRRQSSPILTEMEMPWDWTETVLTDGELTHDDLIEAESAAFDTWLGGGEPKRRQLLHNEINHPDLRRSAARAARERAHRQAG